MDNQNTKVCKQCQTEIPKKAKVCPQCRKKQGGKLKWIMIALVAIIIIGAAGGGSDDKKEDKGSDSKPKSVGTVEEKKEETKETAKEEEVDNEFAVGEIVETSDVKISFLSAQEYTSDNMFLEPNEGYVFYRMEFEFENISDSDQTMSSMLDWSCYADDYTMEQVWGFDDVLDATISPGKKAKGAIYYQIPVGAQKITIEYETNFWTEDKVIFVVK